MVDLNKEIKLSDLVRRTRKVSARNNAAAATTAPKRSRRRKATPQEIVGLKVGATQLAAAVVKNNGSPELVKLARQPLPRGIVSDGEVHDVAALAAGLQEFFTVNDLPKRGVRLGLATNHVGVRIFELAGIDDERQLANAVLFRAHEAVSIPIEEAIIDYRVLSQEVDANGTLNRRILVVAAYREPIERSAEACRQAGLKLTGIDLEAFALLRAVGAEPSVDGQQRAALVVVNTGHERTTLAVSDGAICQFTRVLGWGGSRLSSAIERELLASPDEAHEMLLSLSFHPDAADGDGDNGFVSKASRARTAALRELPALARELVASLEFYQGQPDSLPISEILISGGTSRIPGFVEELERLARVRVRQADPLRRVGGGGSFEERDDLASLAVAIGLGVED